MAMVGIDAGGLQANS